MTYHEAVRTLARWHRESEQPAERILLFPDPNEEIVRLIEVTDLVPETGEFYPIRFGRTDELPYVTIVALVTPAEWDRIRRGEIELPDGWDLSTSEEVAA